MTCPCGHSCACHGGGAYPPPCDVPGGCGTTTACAATGCTRPAAPILCETDTRRLGDWLAQLGAEYELLSAVPSMQGREPGTGGGGGLASHRAPGGTHAMALRSRHRGTGRIGWDDADPWGLDDTPAVYETLHTYAEMVRAPAEAGGRGLTAPTVDLAYVRAARPAGPVCDPHAPPCGHHTCEVWTFRMTATPALTVLSERKLLSDHLDWILGQDFAGEFFDEIRALWGLLRAANGHSSGARRVRCREDGCTGSVRWVDGAAVCGTCGATTRGPELLRVAAEEAA